MEIVRVIRVRAIEASARALAANNRPPSGLLGLFGLGAAYARISRALSMAILLETRLEAELRKPDSEIAADLDRAQAEVGLPDDPEDAEGEESLEDRPERVERAERAERLEGLEPFERACAGRADDEDLERYVMSRPVEELIQEICRDLGLGPGWLRQEEDAWVQEAMAAARTPGPRTIAPPAPPSQPWRPSPADPGPRAPGRARAPP